MDTKAIAKATTAVNRSQKKLVKATAAKDVTIAKAVEKAESRFTARLTAATAAVAAAQTALAALVNGTPAAE